MKSQTELPTMFVFFLNQGCVFISNVQAFIPVTFLVAVDAGDL